MRTTTAGAKKKTPTFSVGRDCDAWCTRCKLDLAHTIVAMVDGLPVQVICNTCNGKHKYRPPKSAGGGAAARGGARRASGGGKGRVTKAQREAAAAAALQRRTWQEHMASHGGVGARRYNPREGFAVGEALSHAKFGLGFVSDALAFNRVKVLFEDGERTLVMNHGKQAPEG